MVSIAICESGKAEDYNHIINSLTNEEMQLKKKNGDNSNEKALYTHTKGKKFQNKYKFNGTCNFCGMCSYKEQECRRKPQQMHTRSTYEHPRSTYNGRCNHCNIHGHKESK